MVLVVTYSRISPSELYNVSHEGLAGGLSRLLVYLNYPVALVAIAVVGVLLERGVSPLGGGIAIALCAVTAVPGVVSQSDLDARLVNGLPALGVALAVALTIRARPLPWFAPGDRLDPVRVAIATLVVLGGFVWVFAAFGFYAGSPFLAEKIPTGDTHHAVHLGHHEGLDGMLLVLSALLLSRVARSAPLRAYVALMFVYGFAVELGDFWHEQFVKRGWIHSQLPSVLTPSISLGWAVIVIVTIVLWRLTDRP